MSSKNIPINEDNDYLCSGAGSIYLSGAPEFTRIFSGIRVTRSLLFYV